MGPQNAVTGQVIAGRQDHHICIKIQTRYFRTGKDAIEAILASAIQRPCIWKKDVYHLILIHLVLRGHIYTGTTRARVTLLILMRIQS